MIEDSFIPEEDVQGLLRTCDSSLLTYQCPVGSSGVMIRAAAAFAGENTAELFAASFEGCCRRTRSGARRGADMPLRFSCDR